MQTQSVFLTLSLVCIFFTACTTEDIPMEQSDFATGKTMGIAIMHMVLDPAFTVASDDMFTPFSFHLDSLDLDADGNKDIGFMLRNVFIEGVTASFWATLQLDDNWEVSADSLGFPAAYKEGLVIDEDLFQFPLLSDTLFYQEITTDTLVSGSWHYSTPRFLVVRRLNDTATYTYCWLRLCILAYHPLVVTDLAIKD